MRQKFGKFLAGLGALTLAWLVLVSVLTAIKLGSRPGVPDVVVLELNLEGEVPETGGDDPLEGLLGDKRPSLLAILRGLERAGADDRVKGAVVRIGRPDYGLARVQELRRAIVAFRESGRFALCFAETFGEVAPGSGAYYLATACDEIWLQPSGDLGLTGLRLEVEFYKNTLAKLGVVPRLDHRHEFKNAMNTFTEEAMTEAHREAMTHLASALYGQIVDGIAEGRDMKPGHVRSLVDRGPWLGQETVDNGLVDRVGYRDEVFAFAKDRAGEDAELLYVSKYVARTDPPDEGPKVAVIWGVGGVKRGRSQDAPWSSMSMGSETVAAAFRSAIDDEDVEAILFRVDSPGGSYVASDAIWREVVRAREAKKPVVAWMGDLAASGGYFVSMAADRIVASEATLTGSIGVLGGKVLTRGLLEWLGVTFDSVQQGANATMYSTIADYTEHGWARHQAWLDRVYDDFTTKAAEGRGLDVEALRKVAKGRVWTGADAVRLGLADSAGGFPDALAALRELKDVDAKSPLRLMPWPQRREPLERLLDEGPESSEHAARSAGLGEALTAIARPVATLLERAGVAVRPGRLRAPDVRVIH